MRLLLQISGQGVYWCRAMMQITTSHQSRPIPLAKSSQRTWAQQKGIGVMKKHTLPRQSITAQQLTEQGDWGLRYMNPDTCIYWWPCLEKAGMLLKRIKTPVMKQHHWWHHQTKVDTSFWNSQQEQRWKHFSSTMAHIALIQHEAGLYLVNSGLEPKPKCFLLKLRRLMNKHIVLAMRHLVVSLIKWVTKRSCNKPLQEQNNAINWHNRYSKNMLQHIFDALVAVITIIPSTRRHHKMLDFQDALSPTSQ